MPDPVRAAQLRVLLPPAVGQAPTRGPAPGLSGFVPARSILPSISITQQRLKQLDMIQLVRELRDNGKQELAYHTRPFVLCGIPLRRPPPGELVHRRQNGKFFLEIVAHPRFGLPTVRADCTCSQFAFGMGRDLPSLPPAAWSAI